MRLTMRGSRTYKWLAAFLVAMMLTPVLAFAQDKQIVEIKITGNDHVSNEAIMAVIAPNLKPGMAFSEEAVQKAKEAMENMGYFQSGVTVGTESTDAGTSVVFNVVENPVVKEINISGNSVAETEKLRSLMRTSVGGVLNTNTLLQQDIPAIEQYYRDQNYIAFVTEDVGIDPETGVLNLPILEVRIENIKITGLNKTKEYVVTREMDQKPGDVYNSRTLYNDLQRVYDLGIFEIEGSVPYKTEPGSDLGKVNVLIPMKERKTGEVSLGLGYGSKSKLTGQAKLTESNFRGRGETVNLLWEQSSRETSTGGSSYEVGFFEPWLDSKHSSLGVNLYNKLIFRFGSSLGGTNVGDYDERHKGGSATLSRPLSQRSRGFLTFRSESVDTSLSGTNAPLVEPGTVTSGTARFTSDKRDSQIEPFAGFYNSYAVEVGNANLEQVGSNAFTKYSTDIRYYFSKGGPRKELTEQKPVIALRLMAGSLSGKVPFYEQYFVGGAETLRGYREDRFWGDSMLVGSAEYRLPLGSSLIGVAFVDYGDAWNSNPRFLNILPDLLQHESFKGNFGYGIGVRVQTPIGPLRLDYGFGSEGSRAHFSMGHAF